MFFEINEDDIQEIAISSVSTDMISVGYLSLEELEKNKHELLISDAILWEFKQEQTHFRNSIDVYDDFSLGIINIINLMDIDENRERIGFIIRKKQFILIKLMDKDDSYQGMFLDSIGRFKQKPTLEKLIYGILDRLIMNSGSVLEDTERYIMEMEQDVVNGNTNEVLNKIIFSLRNDLSIIKNYYEQLADIGEELQENANGLFGDSELRYFKIFSGKTTRLISNIQTLSENLIHVREALDATLNYNLNRVMKLFTVVTTIFLPLSLIAGWYGMNFKYMPELFWKYGYASVIILSIFVVTICIVIFKKKKLL